MSLYIFMNSIFGFVRFIWLRVLNAVLACQYVHFNNCKVSPRVNSSFWCESAVIKFSQRVHWSELGADVICLSCTAQCLYLLQLNLRMHFYTGWGLWICHNWNHIRSDHLTAVSNNSFSVHMGMWGLYWDKRRHFYDFLMFAWCFKGLTWFSHKLGVSRVITIMSAIIQYVYEATFVICYVRRVWNCVLISI